MKICLVIVVTSICGMVGYRYKNKIKTQLIFLRLLEEYLNYLEANITLFKTNLHEINNKFIILQKNKNANNINLYKNNIIYNVIIDKNFDDYIYNKAELDIIKNYFSYIGKNEYEFEKENIEKFKKFVANLITKTEKDLKEKGELYFKLSLAIGVVISIIIW